MKTQRMALIIILTQLALGSFPGAARAELYENPEWWNPKDSDLYPAQSASPTPPPLKPANGLAAGGMQSAFDAQGEVPKVQENTEVIDRQNNADQAASQANAGAAAAFTAGGIMIGMGTPMSLSIIPPVSAAGWSLIGMGIAELAQGAASLAAGGANTAQGDQLENNEGQMGQQMDPMHAAQNVKLPDDLDAFLRGQGLNPDDIVKQAANGVFNDPDAMMKAFGQSFSPEDMAAAKTLVNEELGKTQLGEILKIDEANQELALGSMGARGFGSEVPPAGAGADAKKGDPSAASAHAGGHGTGGGAVREPASKDLFPGLAEAEVKDILAKWGLAGANLTPEQKKAIVDMVLGQNGVSRSKPGENIFQMASGKYKSFKKWRARQRVARL